MDVGIMESVQMDTQGRVISLFMKIEKGMPLSRPRDGKFLLRSRFGIEGDANADGVGPRQVLLVALKTLQAFKLQPGDLRENIVVAGLPLDDLPSGSVLQFGDSATVRLTYHCEVCKYIGTLGVKPIQSLVNQRGFLAVALTGGVVCEGDPVRVLSRCYDPVPDQTADRFLWVVKQIPFGRVMTYKQIVDVLGVSHSYYRVLPTYMKRVRGQAYPLHRILDSKGCLTPHVDNQRALLECEGVEVNAGEGGNGWVDVSVFGWDISGIYY
ncbi:MAG: MGMT family protein [Gemmatimonadetes bacterium]|nr:MGMT family protein [Gemmatimonadota bacterium]